MTMIDTPVTRALTAAGVAWRAFEHPGPVLSLEQAAQERGQTPDQVVRTIVFRVAQAEFMLGLVTGARQLAWPALRRYLGQSRLTLATEAEVLTATGYERGAVAPLGLPQPLRLLADERVWEPEEISIGSGRKGTTIILQSADLRRALPKVETGDFAGGGRE